MDVAEFTQLVDDFNYLLARISKYLKNNQYVYLRAFHSWLESYNLAAERLNADRALRVPVFELTPADYSASGKSIRQECVAKFIRTVRHQVGRLEDHIRQLETTAAAKRAGGTPLESFFHRDSAGRPLEPPPADHRILVAIPPGETALHTFWQGIQPALETQGLSFFLANHCLIDDAGLRALCLELHSCRLAICDLSGQSANVMLTLGLAYGAGKPIIVLQQQGERTCGLLVNDGYVLYSGAADLKTALTALLVQRLRG